MPMSMYSFQPLLEGKLNAQADRGAVILLRAAVAGLHDARPSAGNDRKTGFHQQARRLDRRPVVGIVRLGARRAENRDRSAQPCQRVEALDEFAHDAEYPPRVAVSKRLALPGR